MKITFGWGSGDIEFVPRTETVMQHVRWSWTERGGYDASPTGVSYEWTSEPASIPQLIAQLQAVYADFEAWKAEFIASHPTLEGADGASQA